MAGTIIADFIRTDANQLSLNVGNTTFATINASGFFSNTGTQLIAANGKISGASLVSGSIPGAALSTAANTIPRSAMTSGAVLQVVSATKTDTFSTGSQAPTFVDITGLSVTISPTNSNNKIFIQAYISIGSTAAQLQYFRLVRNSTAICVGDAAGSRNQSTFAWYYGNGDTISHIGALPITFLDSPSTTSATTYKIQMAVQNSGGTSYVNRNGSDSDSVIYGTRAASTITVMEIAG